MRVRVRLFAILRERAGRSELELDLPEGARVSDALAEVDEIAGGIPLVMAVNREYADADAPLGSGDELALIPPVSGGGDDDPLPPKPPYVVVTGAPLALDALTSRVRDQRAGAVVTFLGVTREVDRIEYEAYIDMAREKIHEIAAAAITRHGLCAAAAAHRIGDVPTTEPSVAIAVSAPHREEAFAGAREIIDRIKAEAPIWKREVSGEDAEWVEGTPPTS